MEPEIVRSSMGDDPPTAKLYYGIDVVEGLKLLPDASVHMVATSPPYWALRDYGVEGQLGNGESPGEYVERMVSIFEGVKRVLRPDGTVWLNLGDSFSGTNTRRDSRAGWFGLKQKDLVGIPWRVALALQADGWYLRSNIIWVKGSCLPEAVRNRPTGAHEMIFLLAHPESGGRYFYDIDAIRESAVGANPHGRKAVTVPSESRNNLGYDGRIWLNPNGRNKRSWWAVSGGSYAVVPVEEVPVPAGAASSWWKVNPKAYKGAHFAVWPPKLVEPMVRAGTSERGCCSTCGTPWVRETGRACRSCGAFVSTQANACPSCGYVHDWKADRYAEDSTEGRALGTSEGSSGRGVLRKRGSMGYSKTFPRKWHPGCECSGGDTVRPVVLDLFSGSATTGFVALKEGRDYVGIDLNAEYLPLAKARILGNEAPRKFDADEEGLDLIGDLFGIEEGSE